MEIFWLVGGRASKTEIRGVGHMENNTIPLARFAYVSHATAGLSNSELAGIVQVASRWNADHGITGFLEYRNQKFRQLIEGHPSTLSALIARILADRRHEKIEVKQYSLSENRMFSDWRVAGFDNVFAQVRHAEKLRNLDAGANVIFSDIFMNDRASGRVLRGDG